MCSTIGHPRLIVDMIGLLELVIGFNLLPASVPEISIG